MNNVAVKASYYCRTIEQTLILMHLSFITTASPPIGNIGGISLFMLGIFVIVHAQHLPSTVKETQEVITLLIIPAITWPSP